MTLQTTSTRIKSDLLRRALQANSIFSGVSGGIFIAAAGPLTSFLGLDAPVILILTGVLLILYAVGLWQTAARNPINRRLALIAVILDAAWVIGSLAILLTGWLSLTTGGRWVVAIVADVVAIFAGLQWYALRQNKGGNRGTLTTHDPAQAGKTGGDISPPAAHNSSRRGRSKGLLWWAKRFFGGLIVLLLILAAGGAIYQANATASDERKYPPPGQLVDVGGYRLHIYCLGEESPSVVIDAGAGNWSLTWRHLQPQIAQDTRVCIYDRAGLGWSDPGPQPRTSRQIVDELHTLLHSAGIAPPYVLVGHSFGGYNARVYADRYPREMAGMVLVESAHEDQWARLPPEVMEFLNSQLAMLRTAGVMSRVGLLREIQVPPHPFLSPELQPDYQAAWVRSKTYDAFVAEVESAVGESPAQVAATGSLGDMPLAVVSARHSFDAFRTPPNNIPYEQADEVWMELQTELVALSTNSTHFISETGTHEINFTDPDLVIDAISWVVTLIRDR